MRTRSGRGGARPSISRDVDAQMVTSFAVSAGARNAAGLWTPDQARRLLAYTRWLGASVAAAEFMNEPTLAASNGAPAGYDAKASGRNQSVPRVALTGSPGTLILGPGSVGESSSAPASGMATADIFVASGGDLNAFSSPLQRRFRDGAVAGTFPASPSPMSGSPKPTRHLPTTDPFATAGAAKAALADGDRGRRLRRKSVGLQPLWIRSAISISLGDWRKPAFRSSCTTRWRRAITACLIGGNVRAQPN